MLAGLTALLGGGGGGGGSFESIATVTGTVGATSLTFNSIPSTYKHLQVRGISVNTGASSVYMRANSDSSNIYSSHALVGYGSGVGAYTGSGPSGNNINIAGWNGTVATYPNAIIMEILDYADTSKYKTFRTFWGADNNSTGGSIELTSGLYQTTSAITSLTFTFGYSIAAGTQFALYGIKG